MATAENCPRRSQICMLYNEKLLRPKVQLQTLLRDAGADKDVFTMREVMFYLGKYIMSKELYDKQQQHIVHCGNDALGAVLGVASFSVKEPRALCAMISKNLIAVKIPESQSAFRERRALSDADREPEETHPRPSTSTQQQQRRRRWSSDPTSVPVEEESGEPRKRHKSDSIPLALDDSLSSEPSVSHNNSDVGGSHSDGSDDSDSDNFSVEFEVESIDSEAYSGDDEDSVPGEDEVTIIAADEDSFDDDTEITEEDPGNNTQTATKPDATCINTELEAKAPCAESPTPTLDPDVAVDGKSSRWQSTSCSDSQGSSLCYSQPSTSSSHEETPRTTSSSSTESCLPASCLEHCVICQSRPKNGCIVHGRTGHLMACYTCAKKLQKRKKLCPMCREPIQCVILAYVC